MTMAEQYLMGAATSELDRMLYQGEMFRPEAERLLDRCGPGPGARAADVGCGPLGILDLLSERVGPGGEVVGLDVQPEMLRLARSLVAERRLDNVRLVEGDAADTAEDKGGFDFVHTRLVLMNVPHSGAVLSAMVALARPGGTIAVQDVDWVTRVCDPRTPRGRRSSTSSPSCGASTAWTSTSAAACRACSARPGSSTSAWTPASASSNRATPTTPSSRTGPNCAARPSSNAG